mgnify:CR=1 FL=1
MRRLLWLGVEAHTKQYVRWADQHLGNSKNPYNYNRSYCNAGPSSAAMCRRWTLTASASS